MSIFGKKEAPAQAAPQPTQPAPAPTPTPSAAPAQPGDVEAVPTGIAPQTGDPDLHWRTSIVDPMKLRDPDASLDNRQELATELGRPVRRTARPR